MAGGGNKFQNDFCNDRQGPLGADEQSREAVSRCVLYELSPGVHDGAVGEYKLKSKYVIPGGAVFDRSRATRSHGHIPPYGAGIQAGGVRRIHQSVFQDRPLEVAGNYPGLHGTCHVFAVNFKYAVHPFAGEHQAAAHCHRSPGDAGAGPPGGYRYIKL